MYHRPDLVVRVVSYDLTRAEDRARTWRVIDSVAAFECSESGTTVTGSGLFEYWPFGPPAPTSLE